VWTLSTVRGTLYVSSQVRAILGYTPEYLHRHPHLWADSIHPGDRDCVRDAVARFDERGSLDVEYRIRDSHGEWRVLHDRSIGREVSGEETLIRGISADITEHRQAEEALRESENLYRATIDALADMVHVVDPDLTITLMNEAFRKAMEDIDLDPNVIGVNLLRALPFLPEGTREAYRRVVATGESFVANEEIRFGTRTICTETRKIPILERGEVVRVVTVVRDVSEHRQAEEIQSVLFQISQAASDSADLGEFLTVIHRELGRLIDTTNFYVALYSDETSMYSFPYHVDQYDCDEIGQVALKDSLTDYVRRTGEALMVDPQEHGDLIDRGEVILIGAQSTIWLGVPLKAAGKVIGVVAVQSYDDVAPYTAEDRELLAFVSENIAVAIERKWAEEDRHGLEAQIQQAQKLESLGVLAGGIAHDFNNLLTGILGNSDLALTHVAPESPVTKHIKQIKTTAERAADLSRQMLAYSGRGSFVIEQIDLSDLVNEMGHLLEVSISKKAVIRYEVAAEAALMVGDVTQIRQVVMNLITNASDAMGDDEGVITLATGTVECDRANLADAYVDDQLADGVYVYLEVADTGCGMDNETRRRIFDPFFTTKFTGRGLGLASVIGIIRGHRGAVVVDSKPGKGTRFRVLFPTDTSPCVEITARPTATPESEATGTVLLVDDEETIRDVGTLMLEMAGFSVVTAEDGVAAVDFYRDHADEIACVLLDLTMPRMGGEETFRELRQIREDVRVVISSGYSGSEINDRFVGQGIAGFVQKPYMSKELIDEVRAAVDGPAPPGGIHGGASSVS